MRLPHAKFIIAGLAIVGAICFLMFSGINDSMVYYYTVTELKDQSSALTGKGVRVSGHVQPESIQKDSTGTRVEFVVFEKTTDNSLNVVYEGVIPDTFKDNAEVVVEGTYDPGTASFYAQTLLAKCPSKYEGKADEHPGDYPSAETAANAQ
jgi:cytochrome c-type biogenesis protein CcmE